jgi:hypothetical protein
LHHPVSFPKLGAPGDAHFCFLKNDDFTGNWNLPISKPDNLTGLAPWHND